MISKCLIIELHYVEISALVFCQNVGLFVFFFFNFNYLSSEIVAMAFFHLLSFFYTSDSGLQSKFSFEFVSESRTET